MRFPRRGWAPSTLADGFGPVTERRYWLEVADAPRLAPEVAQLWLQDMPRLVPPLLSWFRRVRPGHGDTGVGDRFRILMAGLRRGRVVVEQVTPQGFHVRTLRQHPESGTSHFCVEPQGAGRYRLQIRSLSRTSSALDRLAYLLGLREVQRLTWELTLRRVRRLSGGRVVDHGHQTREWPYRAEADEGAAPT